MDHTTLIKVPHHPLQNSMFLYVYSSETNLKIKKARPATYNITCSVSGDDYPAQFMGRSCMHVPTIHAFIVSLTYVCPRAQVYSNRTHPLKIWSRLDGKEISILCQALPSLSRWTWNQCYCVYASHCHSLLCIDIYQHIYTFYTFRDVCYAIQSGLWPWWHLLAVKQNWCWIIRYKLVFWRGWCGTLKRAVWYFGESGVVLLRGLCGTLKRVVWYFEECDVVLWRGWCGTLKRVV